MSPSSLAFAALVLAQQGQTRPGRVVLVALGLSAVFLVRVLDLVASGTQGVAHRKVPFTLINYLQTLLSLPSLSLCAGRAV